MATAPVGTPLCVARNHASAKHVPLANCPLTQATSKMNGNMLSLVRALMSLMENPLEDQAVCEPCPV
jgi:hypothetical protein